MTWTEENLRDVVREKIGTHKFLVVSNREPYIHTCGDKGIQCMTDVRFLPYAEASRRG